MMRVLDVPLTAFYYCPHLPGGSVPGYSFECSCRKPRPGLILRAARELSIDTTASWYIGNVPTDVEAGRGAGCRTVLLQERRLPPPLVRPEVVPHRICRNLLEAGLIIRKDEAYTV
jgi:histidinol phosphatase-like enzyme